MGSVLSSYNGVIKGIMFIRIISLFVYYRDSDNMTQNVAFNVLLFLCRCAEPGVGFGFLCVFKGRALLKIFQFLLSVFG